MSTNSVSVKFGKEVSKRTPVGRQRFGEKSMEPAAALDTSSLYQGLVSRTCNTECISGV